MCVEKCSDATTGLMPVQVLAVINNNREIGNSLEIPPHVASCTIGEFVQPPRSAR